MNNVIKIAALLCAVMLVGCGGGGGGSGGGTASTNPTTEGDTAMTPPTDTTDDGTTMMPTEGDPVTMDPVVPDPVVPDPVVPDPVIPDPVAPPPSTTSGGIPNSRIPAAGTGTKEAYYMASCRLSATQDCYTDSATGAVTSVKDFDDSVYPEGVSAGYRRIEGPVDGDPSLIVPNPPQDVRDAWRDGWTGQGVNLLIIDSFGGPEGPTSRFDERGTHGYTVGMAALEIVPFAAFGALEAGISSAGGGTDRDYRDTYIAPEFDIASAPTFRIDVINMSFGLVPEDRAPTSSEVTSVVTELRTSELYADLTGGLGSGTALLTNSGDAVLVKAAGNDDGTDASWYLDNAALVQDSHTGPRSLIVGALDSYARGSTTDENFNVSSDARIDSAYAGADSTMQERFLVEYGGTPYNEKAYLCDEDVDSSERCTNAQELHTFMHYPSIFGTSFAAPRVAGFAALVRHKFPSITGAQTAKILLDTANYEGLSCAPNCRVDIYGQGHVDIADALSPIGKLE